MMDGIRIIRPAALLVVLLCALMVTAAAVPPLPAEFYGTVTLQGSPAPAGTAVVAKINDQVRGQLSLRDAGTYGGTGIFDDKLVVAATEEDLKTGPVTVSFTVGDVQADQTVPFEAGKVQKLDLIAGGGSGGIDAGFTATPTSGSAPLTVQFTDTSTGSPTMWSWDFGDGSSQGMQANPSHTYTAPGTYTVTLTASSQTGGSSTETKAGFITVSQAGSIDAEFTASPTSGSAPLTVQFTDASTGSPTMWSWDFGDGSSQGMQANPSHTYTAPGTYTVTLTASSQTGGSSTETKAGFITVSGSGAGPAASFTVDKRSGPKPLTVQFTDTSTGLPTMWMWNFGDGTNDTVASPSHTYQKAGVFTVSLTASNQAGSDTRVEKDYISVTGDIPPPVAMFEAAPLSGSAPLTVQFTDLSIGPPETYYWDFGDASTSDQANPSHTYASPGSYTVTLTVSNSGGSHTMKRENYVSVGGGPGAISANFTGAPTSGTAPLTVQFTDTSTGGPTMWSWNFGDGTSQGMLANPSHTYNASGTYTVTLTASSQTGGSSTKVREGYITVSPSGGVVADFTAAPTSGSAPLTVQFTDASTGGPTMWSWNFGDGGTDMIACPSHTYTASGTYTVTLTASSQTGGSSTRVREGYITVGSGGIIADFIGTPASGLAPLTVQFSDRSTGGPTMWSWEFGDGGTDMIASPSHTYQSPGTYTVKLTASNQQSSNTVTKAGYISASQAGPGGSVKITYAPDRSQVYLNDQLRGETRFLQTFRIDSLPAGVNKLRISKPGFTDYIRDISVGAGKTAEVIADMRIKPTNNGILSVYTYPAGSAVYLDGVSVGTGPLWLPDVSPGIHSLRVTANEHLDWNHQIEVMGGGSVTYVTAALYPSWWTPTYGYIMVSSLPGSGTAFLDGVSQGTTPVTLSQVTPGVHKVKVELPGYSPYEQEVTVMEGRTSYVIAQMGGQGSGQNDVIPMSVASVSSAS